MEHWPLKHVRMVSSSMVLEVSTTSVTTIGVQTVRDVSMSRSQLPVGHVSMHLASLLVAHVNSTTLNASMASPSTSHALLDLPTMGKTVSVIGLILLSTVYLKRLLGSDALPS